MVALKVLARPPRGTTAATFHGLGRKQLQRVQFAEQIQVRQDYKHEECVPFVNCSRWSDRQAVCLRSPSCASAEPTFAAGPQLVGAGMVLSTKDRKVAAVLQPQPPSADDDDPEGPVGGASSAPSPVLAEIRSLYCMPSGAPNCEALVWCWAVAMQQMIAGATPKSFRSNLLYISCCCVTGEYWAEYCRFYTADDIDNMAAECGRPIALPTDFDRRHELLRGIERLHCPVADIRGAMVKGPHSSIAGSMETLRWCNCTKRRTTIYADTAR